MLISLDAMLEEENVGKDGPLAFTIIGDSCTLRIEWAYSCTRDTSLSSVEFWENISAQIMWIEGIQWKSQYKYVFLFLPWRDQENPLKTYARVVCQY